MRRRWENSSRARQCEVTQAPTSTFVSPTAVLGDIERVRFAEADTYAPESGSRRVALAGSPAFSFEWFEKPPGHASPLHDHENEQVCLCLSGELAVVTPDDSVRIGRYDFVHLAEEEPHRVINTGEERAVGLEVFAPGRSFDFWSNRDRNGMGE